MFSPAAHRRAGARRARRQRLHPGDPRPRPRHGPRGAPRRQPPARRDPRVRTLRHRPARPLRGQPARPAAERPGLPPALPVRRHHGRASSSPTPCSPTTSPTPTASASGSTAPSPPGRPSWRTTATRRSPRYRSGSRGSPRPSWTARRSWRHRSTWTPGRASRPPRRRGRRAAADCSGARPLPHRHRRRTAPARHGDADGRQAPPTDPAPRPGRVPRPRGPAATDTAAGPAGGTRRTSPSRAVRRAPSGNRPTPGRVTARAATAPNRRPTPERTAPRPAASPGRTAPDPLPRRRVRGPRPAPAPPYDPRGRRGTDDLAVRDGRAHPAPDTTTDQADSAPARCPAVSARPAWHRS